MMWGGSMYSGTTAGNYGCCSGTCSCPNCGYTYSTYTFFGAASNGYESHFGRSVRQLREAAKRNPKWRIWHQPATVARPIVLPLAYIDARSRPVLLARSVSSAAQRRRHKRRRWQQSMRRSLNSPETPHGS
jgi:hypothetical protein